MYTEMYSGYCMFVFSVLFRWLKALEVYGENTGSKLNSGFDFEFPLLAQKGLWF